VNFQSLQDTVARFTSMDYASKDLPGSEDGSHIFEVFLCPHGSSVVCVCICVYIHSRGSGGLFCFNLYPLQAIGLLIGMEDVPLEKQSDYLSALLTPLCQQVLI
jgi:exportin-T